MAAVRPRTWKTRRGALRRGYELSWYQDGKRHRLLFTGRGARDRADKKRVQVESALQSGVAPVGNQDLTVLDAGKRWIDGIAALGRERSTTDMYETHLNLHLGPLEIHRADRPKPESLGDIRVVELTGRDAELVKDALVAKLSIAMAQKVMRSFRMLLNDCTRRGPLSSNPALATRIVTVDRGEDEELEIPSRAELKKLLATIKSKPPAPPTFTEAWIVTVMLTGLRPSEARGLAIEDLVLVGPKPGIPVRRRADKWQQIGAVKSKRGRRFVAIGPKVIALLRRWLLVVPRGDGFADPERPEEKLRPLFPTVDGTVQSLANIYNRMWVEVMRRAGLVEREPDKREEAGYRLVPRYSVNCLRHLYASIMIDQGMDVKRLSTRMGHSSVKVTLDVYGKLFRDREDDAAEMKAIERDILS